MSEPRLAWDTEGLRHQLDRFLPGLRIEVVASAESTNSALLDRARRGERSPCLLVAQSQTGGRGRSGRRWHSSPGASLTFSLMLELHPADWSGLSLAVGLAVADALDPPGPRGSPRIGLKWPNDLMLCNGAEPSLPRKLGGILIESIQAAGVRMAVIGIGLNVAPQPLPEFDLGHAWLREWLVDADAARTLAIIAAPLASTLRDFEQGGFAPLVDRYARRDLLAGRAVRCTQAGLGEGLAEGVDADGALRLRVGQQLHRVTSGEVSVRLAQAERTC